MKKKKVSEEDVLEAIREGMLQAAGTTCGFTLEGLAKRFTVELSDMRLILIRLDISGQIERFGPSLYRPKPHGLPASPNLRFKNRTHEE